MSIDSRGLLLVHTAAGRDCTGSAVCQAGEVVGVRELPERLEALMVHLVLGIVREDLHTADYLSLRSVCRRALH